MAEPRKAHFMMKDTLSEFAAGDFNTFFNAFSPPHGRQNLRDIWDQICKTLPANERFAFSGDSATHPLPKGGTALIITMPPPLAPNEAYFLAVVPSGAAGSVVVMLEQSVADASNHASTMMVGVTADGGGVKRINFGPGPTPTRVAFIAAVEKLLVPRSTATADSATAPATKDRSAANDVSKAIAYVKFAGLTGPASDNAQVRLATEGAALPEDQQPVVRVMAGGFGVTYVIDEGDHFTYINRGDLAASGLSVEQLHATGLKNLVAKTSKKDGQPGLSIRQNGTFYAVLMGGNFEASLLLVDTLWDNAQVRNLTPNGCVIALPARDLLVFCDSRSVQGVADLAAFSKKATSNSDHLLTPDLYARNNGQWAKFAG